MKPLIAVSSCLLGQSVRYDGGHKRDEWLVESLSPFVTWCMVCPEVEVGLGVPREPVELTSDGAQVSLLAVQSRRDLTEEMLAFAHQKVALLQRDKIAGYILKSKSPSCALQSARITPSLSVRSGMERGDHAVVGEAGLFVRVLVEMMPQLAVIEESSLADAFQRKKFLTRLFAGEIPRELVSRQ